MSTLPPDPTLRVPGESPDAVATGAAPGGAPASVRAHPRRDRRAAHLHDASVLKGATIMISLLFPALALIGAGIHLWVMKVPRTRERIADVLALYLLVFGIGVSSLFAFFGHTFRPDQTAESIGWPTGNLFQLEVAATNLGFGVLGVLCIWLRGSFWLATALSATCFLWGAAYAHIYDYIVNDNTAINNTGPILYTDIFVPLAILLLLAYVRRAERTHAQPAPADTASAMARAGGRVRPQHGA